MLPVSTYPQHNYVEYEENRQPRTTLILGNSKTCLKRPLKNRQNEDLHDKW